MGAMDVAGDLSGNSARRVPANMIFARRAKIMFILAPVAGAAAGGCAGRSAAGAMEAGRPEPRKTGILPWRRPADYADSDARGGVVRSG